MEIFDDLSRKNRTWMPAIKLTEDLLLSLQQQPYSGDAVISALTAVILRNGSIDDASAVCDHLIANPASFDHYELLEIIKRWGNAEHAERIFKVVIENKRLKEPVDPAVLEIFGALKYFPAKEVLVHYSFDEDDHYLHKHAVLGLVGLDCSDLQGKISEAIDGVYGKNLFPEFIPALVGKLSTKGEKLRKLYESGKHYASSDCNAGILLGFSLSGEEGKEYFLKALFDPAWEVPSTATGSRSFAFRGLMEQGISFIDVYEEVQKEGTGGNGEYALIVFLSLLEESIFSYWGAMRPLNFTQTYEVLYGETDNLLQVLAEGKGMEDEILRLEKLLRLRVYEEISFSAGTGGHF